MSSISVQQGDNSETDTLEDQTLPMLNFLRSQADDFERRAIYYRELADALERKDIVGFNKSVQQTLQTSLETVKRGRPSKENFPKVKESLQEDKSNKIMAEVANQWKKLEDSEKEKYKNMAANTE